jgi:23S rRNA (uracil1939-C5)-methyltransferase
MAETEIADVERVGARGDGVARAGVRTAYVPFTVPGDRVRLARGARRGDGDAASLIEVLQPGPDRVAARCPHFGACGGCALQQWADDEVLAWKREQVVAALAHRGLDAPVAAILATPPGERRRVYLAARNGRRGAVLGYRVRASHAIVNVTDCPLLNQALHTLLDPLRSLAAEVLGAGEEAAFEVTATAPGPDLVLERPRAPDAAEGRRLAAFAADAGLARISWRAGKTAESELVCLRAPPTVRFGDISVEIPPGGFVQASPSAEAALVGEIRAATETARRIADLYAGCGAFTFALLDRASVRAVERDAEAVAALRQAAHRSGARVEAEPRDLVRRPLQDDELRGFDAVVLDPPRAGARAQAEALARSSVPVVSYVSCHPGTFARDARILVDAGYRLTRVVPVDQFLWSPHVELIGIFQK